MADKKKYPTKPKMESYPAPKTPDGGFDKNLMRAMEYSYDLDEALGLKEGTVRDTSKYVEGKLGAKTKNINKDPIQARARLILATGDGMKAGKTKQQIYEDLNKKYTK